MAITTLRSFRPKPPDLESLDWQAIRFDYDRTSDTLYLDFSGHPTAAVAYPVTDHLLLSIDPESEAVVGFQIEGFLAHFIIEMPIFLEIADLIGLTPSEVAAVRARLDAASRTRAAVRTLFDSLAQSQDATIGA